MHNVGQLTHNNLSLASIYVTADGDWKLGGLEQALPRYETEAAAFKQLEAVVDADVAAALAPGDGDDMAADQDDADDPVRPAPRYVQRNNGRSN